LVDFDMLWLLSPPQLPKCLEMPSLQKCHSLQQANVVVADEVEDD
jgi:hypothetical protein